MLEIESLSLTHEELTEAFVGDALHGFERIAEAQLAKALWGMKDWLREMGYDGIGLAPDLEFTLENELRKAGIKEPSTAEFPAPR